MSRNLKALGLALIAVMAVAAMSATAAQAKNFITADAYPAQLTGIDEALTHGSLGRFTIAGGARSVECTGNILDATITGPSTTTTVEPTYSGCFSNGLTAVGVTVTMNSCDYTIELTGLTTAVAYVDCTKAGDAIEIHIYENESHAKTLCTFTITAQGPITGIEKITNENVGTETEDVTATVNLKEIKVHNDVGSKALCGIAAATSGTATLGGNYTITGEKDKSLVHTKVMVG